MEESVMRNNLTKRAVTVLVTLIILFSLFSSALGAPYTAPASPVSFTILHTNDFHGQLEANNTDPIKASNPGLARTANVVETVRTAKGAANVLLVDAGDEMQGSLLSNLGDGTTNGKGKPTIAAFNTMGYNVATFGNHEFDWGQTNLSNRTTEATYPYVTANIVKKDGVDCASSGWVKPDFADAPYQIMTMGAGPTVKVAFIGVTTTETPTITVASATAGLCFKDPLTSVLHYYDEMKAAGADVIVVLSHLGYSDGGYGYGLPVTGDQTLAQNLIKAGKPVNLIIGGHSHSSVAAPGTSVTVTGYSGQTTVVQAAYNGRRVGEADVTVNTDGSVSINWKIITWTIPVSPAITPPSNWRLSESVGGVVVASDFADSTKNAAVDTVITTAATDPTYLGIVNQPIGYSAVDLPRSNTTDNMMGTFIDDAIYNYLNTDGTTANDIDIFFNNAGGIRTDWCWSGTDWVGLPCATGLHAAGLLTYGDMFTVLPFGNATVVGQMTGAQILEVINYAPNVAGMIQPAGLKYSYFSYKDANPGPQPYAWGAYDVCVVNKVSHTCEPLDLKKTYNVGTNEFLAPAGGDGYNAFKYMTNITYWGDMLNAVNAYVAATYGTAETAYKGPNGDGTLDARIKLNGDGDTTYDVGEIVPLTILHHNDSHGNLAKGTYVGYTQLATLIKQERLHNPDRTLLLNAGDSFQGDAMMYYFKDAGAGIASDGTILPPAMQINPLIALMNSMNYTAMTLGNHEFNFGSKVFVDTFTQASFPLLGANVTDSGLYGINKVAGSAASGTAVVNVKDSISLTLPSGGAIPLNVAILGITNHRVPNYELPSNIPGLSFSDPIAKAAELVPGLRAANDVVIAMTHIGFTENTASVEIDANVDTNLAATVNGIDAIIGAHSHTNPATGFGNYKYLPSIVAAPNGKANIINQAYRYNNTLGEVVIGLIANASGGYDVVSQTGRYLSVVTATAEDPATKAIVDPYVAALAAYNTKVIGTTTAPIDALQAFTQETNGANLQADAAMYELESHGITPDFHLSGAMTNSKIAATATPSLPYGLTIANMFTAMPYENSLVVISMNGPQLKAVLERGYRNYYYYKYVSGYGGYSYYTTCMLDTNSGNKITYLDKSPALPNGNNVLSLTIGGVPVDFTNATKYYDVSTVNYLAAGSCNFNNSGVTLWPLNQIVADTQYYVRDAVIDYITHEGSVSPAIEGRLDFRYLINKYFYPIIRK
jgi:2',3'-cyclic-nucleotide 2'-phosphodiesterase/3'-nucleotidase/5'-nucleotidase